MDATDDRWPLALPRAILFAIAAVGIWLAPPAQADRVSGTWTGTVEGRGNYYWEQSTRVVAPSFHFNSESPEGVRLTGNYLVDTITSASLASGAIADVRFTEIRHDVSVGAGYEIDFGASQLDLTTLVRHSNEPDYKSYGATFSSILALDQRSTRLRTTVSVLHDQVGKVLRGFDASGPNQTDIGEVGTLDAVGTSVVLNRALTPTMEADLGYDMVYSRGFQANPYRQVAVSGVLVDETHPRLRWRHSLWGRVAWFARPTKSAVHLLYRGYLDSWDIAALTPEVRLYQELSQPAHLRVRYRYYTQTASEFYQPPEQYTTANAFVTADPKMSRFHSHLVGFQLWLRLAFLEGTALDALRRASLDLSFEYIWRTNRFGNGVISQAGMRWPF